MSIVKHMYCHKYQNIVIWEFATFITVPYRYYQISCEGNQKGTINRVISCRILVDLPNPT